jgi:hypothetical protein
VSSKLVSQFALSVVVATAALSALAQTSPPATPVPPQPPTPPATPPTLASLHLACSDFKHNADGSWSPLHSLTLRGATMNPGASFNTGAYFNAVDLPGVLNKECVSALAQTSPPATPPPPQPPTLSATAPTLASLHLACSDFKRNADGSWSPLHSLTLRGATMNPGASFNTDAYFNGVDLPGLLNKECASH